MEDKKTKSQKNTARLVKERAKALDSSKDKPYKPYSKPLTATQKNTARLVKERAAALKKKKNK